MLVVEDEVMIRMAMAAALRDAGFTVIEARDAYEAFDVAQSGIVPDVLFTDVRLPSSIDGLQLAAFQELMFPRMHVLVSSAYMTREDLKLSLNFLPKPVDPYRAVRLIQDALDENARR